MESYDHLSVGINCITYMILAKAKNIDPESAELSWIMIYK